MSAAAPTAARAESGPLDKYLSKPFFGSSHSWAIGEALKLAPSSRVLDIGAGSGPLGKALAEAGFQELYAVEIDAPARDAIRGIYRRVEADLSAYAAEHFDLILILDVLEHLADPAAILRRAAALLNPRGRLLISVPNIAHWSVRIPLIFGKFRYTERGILDKTHLQFFTRKRLDDLLRAEPALSVVSYDSSIPPAEFVLPRWIWDNPAWKAVAYTRRAAARALPGLCAYQHLAMLERRS
jgi:SAM-dependent methyltransferase